MKHETTPVGGLGFDPLLLPRNQQIKVLASAALPAYQTPGSAGMDITARIDEEVVLSPGKSALIKTGLRLALPQNVEAQIRPRSGLALKHGITVLNTPGTIDSDYRGEIGVILINHGHEDFVVRDGDRIAQMVFAHVLQIDLVPVEAGEFENLATNRGEGGFGSTGVARK